MKYINYVNAISEHIRHKSLNTIERDIIDLLTQGKTYLEISNQLAYDDGYIGSVARELYGLIGQKQKVKVTRSNLINVLDSAISGELTDTSYSCQNIKDPTIFNHDILAFRQNEIVINVSTFWKFDVTNNSLILKTKHPIIISLDELKSNSFRTILYLANQEQLTGDMLLELFKILSNYYKEADHD
jgi:hypothetical protein